MLPGKRKLYCSRSGKGISDKEYQLVHKVWDKFEMLKSLATDGFNLDKTDGKCCVACCVLKLDLEYLK